MSKRNFLFAITSRPNKFKDKTINWISNNFGNVFEKIVHSSDFHKDNKKLSKKDLCLKFDLDILIEDNPEYALNCSEAGVFVFLLDKPWNQRFEDKKCYNIYRVDNWKEILGKLQKIYKI